MADGEALAQTPYVEPSDVLPVESVRYRIEEPPGSPSGRLQSFSSHQVSILEKLNRADRLHLARLREIVIPERWHWDELAYSPLPLTYAWANNLAKVIIVHQPLQVFGAYENGRLVHWGPVSTGRRGYATPSGFFHLNWKSKGRHSTVNPRWYMPWYFNFDNARGLSFHAYDLPGYPASHACVRLLEDDAKWLFDWGEQWETDADHRIILKHGTPVLILGRYDFKSTPPWRSSELLSRPARLPADPTTGIEG